MLMLIVGIGDDSQFFVRGLADPAVEEAALDSASNDVQVGVFNARRTRSPRAFEAGALTAVVRSETSPVDLH